MGGLQTRAKTGRPRASPLPTACAQIACLPQTTAQVSGTLVFLLLTHMSIHVMHVARLSPLSIRIMREPLACLWYTIHNWHRTGIASFK